MTLDQWAREHFYLSAESSYVEQRWTPWTFQRAIMACISNDDIEEVTFIKSARVGYTKMILAAMGYFADHKRRNQVVWQPTDDDAEDFVKSELDPMLRDVPVMRKGVPGLPRAAQKDNTLSNKSSSGRSYGYEAAKAAKTTDDFRRMSATWTSSTPLMETSRKRAPADPRRKAPRGRDLPKIHLRLNPEAQGIQPR